MKLTCNIMCMCVISTFDDVWLPVCVYVCVSVIHVCVHDVCVYSMCVCCMFFSMFLGE